MGCIDKAGQELYNFSKDFGLEALSPGRTAENIKAALKAAGKARQCRSPLQPQLMIWLVLCLPIFRSESIPAVLGRLLSVTPRASQDLVAQTRRDDAIAHARGRLGIAPLRYFFRAQAAARLLEFRGPVNAFVTAARRGLVLPRTHSEPTWTLAYRKGDLVYRKDLSAEEHDFLSCPGASDRSKRAQQWIAEGRSEGYL
jgi:hypothetical protein